MADESGSTGEAEPGGWNLGQDDSALHGKHLPPSPRRQPSKSSLKAPRRAPDPDPLLPPPGGRRLVDRHSYSPVASRRVTQAAAPPPSHPRSSSPAPPSGRTRTNSDPQAGTEPPPTQNHAAPSSSTSILRRKVLSKETVKQYQEKALLQRQGSRGQQEAPGAPARSVPWEKEAAKEGLMGFGLCLGQTKGSGQLGGAGPQDQGLLEEIESMCCLGSVLGSGLQLSQVHCNSSHVQGNASDRL